MDDALIPLTLPAMSLPHDPLPATQDPLAGPRDLALAPTFERRRRDWRIGPVTYHVMVDRFNQALDIDAKRHLYESPRKLMKWSDEPKRGHRLEEHNISSQEVEFWGGDLQSLRTGLDHVQRVGADVLYLNPIQDAFSNHKYDANDWFGISPEFGTQDDLDALIADLNERGMRLMLDGVFNHMGRRSPKFQAALAHHDAPERAWFNFHEDHKHGYSAWHDAANLPEVNLNNPEVRAAIWEGEDSVVRSYIRRGVAGWRLDVAYDCGPAILHEITKAAHAEREDALVVGEIWSYPTGWFPSIDGIMNFYIRELVLHFLRDEFPGAGPAVGRALARMIEDARTIPNGYEHLLMSWLVLDNHDTGRLATVIPDARKRAIAQVLQFTLPGAPLVYYGVEAGMTGGHDPEMRGPMRWKDAKPGNPEYDRLLDISAVRARSEALRIGDIHVLDTQHTLAYTRFTDRLRDTRIVVINASDRTHREAVPHRDSRIMGHCPMVCELTGTEVKTESGVLLCEVPPWTAWVLKPGDTDSGYSPYKRIR